MTHFELTNWTLSTLEEASNKALSVLKELAASDGGFAVEAHCQNFATLTQLTEIAPSERCAFYCWKTNLGENDFNHESFRALHRALIRFKSATLVVNDSEELPPYNWNGVASEFSMVTLTVLPFSPMRPEEKEPSLKIAESLASLGTKVTGKKLDPVKITTAWKEAGREHSYLLKVSRLSIPRLISEICSCWKLHDGSGSFEFLGKTEEIAAIHQSQNFKSADFPETCWNLNYPADTAFSYGTRAFLYPQPNVASGALLQLASAIDELGVEIQYRAVVKKYIAWKLSPETASPRVQDNYLLISHQKSGGYRIFLGFERYRDDDPNVRKFTAFVEPVLGRMGTSLKKVSGPQ